jgi:regulator of PEP synthase PpsR (kinase-PPPase family)
MAAMTDRFPLHLVSDATGETILTVARAVVAQFEGAAAEHRLWPFVRTAAAVDDVLAAIGNEPGIVLCTLVSPLLRDRLAEGCRQRGVPFVSLLDPALDALKHYLLREPEGRPGRQHALDSDYFNRIEAIRFSLEHDDGLAMEDLPKADIVLIGVSRTSKTPTSLYLANRGLKAANVPVVPGLPLPEELDMLAGPLVVGLTTSPDRLVEVRRTRLLSLKKGPDTDYVDMDAVREELAKARRYFAEKGWPVIDVTRRSIEETAAEVLKLHDRRQTMPFHLSETL